jgi:hypothetical protein
LTIENVVTAILSAFFLFASSIKVLGWQKMIFETQVAMFVKYGLNRQIMALVGLVELFGAVAIWFHASAVGPLGALAILGTSTGAISFHLIYDTWKDAVPSMITLVLSAILAWTIRMPLLELIN